MHRLSFYVYLISLFTLCSCARHSLYVPTITNTPNFDGTNKYQANAALSFDHVELQTAANPIKGLGLMHNIYYSNKGRNVDLAVGAVAYDSLAKFGVDFFVGYGTGERKYEAKTKPLSDKYYTFYDIDNSFQKYFGQLTLFKSIKSNHQLGFTFRGSYIDYKWFKYSIQTTTFDNYYGLQDKTDQMTNDNLTAFTSDVMLTYKFRYRFIGIFLQPGMHFDNGPKDVEKNLYYAQPNMFFLNTGLNFYFNKLRHND